MGMTERRLMDVDVDQAGPPWGMRHLEPQLLDGFAQGGLGWLLARVDVPAGLHPAGQALVQVEDRAPRAHDDGRRRDMGGVGVLVVGIGQAVQLGQEAGLRRRSPSGEVGRWLGHESPNLSRSASATSARLTQVDPCKTVTAFPPMRTRLPSGRTESTAPRGESWRATSWGRPRTADQ